MFNSSFQMVLSGGTWLVISNAPDMKITTLPASLNIPDQVISGTYSRIVKKNCWQHVLKTVVFIDH